MKMNLENVENYLQIKRKVYNFVENKTKFENPILI